MRRIVIGEHLGSFPNLDRNTCLISSSLIDKSIRKSVAFLTVGYSQEFFFFLSESIYFGENDSVTFFFYLKANSEVNRGH